MLNIVDDFIGIEELRPTLGTVVDSVSEGDRVVVITHRGKAKAALISAHEYQRLLQQADAYQHNITNQAEIKRAALKDGGEAVMKRATRPKRSTA
jgi:prevent-host-death family protein